MKASETIQAIGCDMFGEFSIEQEPLKSAYKSVYENFMGNLSKNNKSKGIAILGSLGIGKSSMMRIYQKMFLGSPCAFKWANSTIIRDMLDECSLSEIKLFYGYDLKCDLYIDDLGVFKAVSNKYGNSFNIISEILYDRYELFVNEGYKTHISSNIPLSLKNNPDNIPTIELVYGNRIKDRIIEMCEIVTIRGTSLRK